MATKYKMNVIDKTAGWLVIVGALNWGLTVFNFNLVTWLANLVNYTPLAKIVYSLVGLSAGYFLVRMLMKFR